MENQQAAAVGGEDSPGKNAEVTGSKNSKRKAIDPDEGKNKPKLVTHKNQQTGTHTSTHTNQHTSTHQHAQTNTPAHTNMHKPTHRHTHKPTHTNMHKPTHQDTHQHTQTNTNVYDGFQRFITHTNQQKLLQKMHHTSPNIVAFHSIEMLLYCNLQ
ncbi:hypothetical protein XELAEV_18038834mg [Xenopus laevis]|uniref:Uncharacterized protein n=1 Tax=Xenopus laevis TaxID=8355 RepID=A0A974C7J4_XENLA|nr:hypothetical protein XELAEV_18038834mg [Xenopus laevis]